MSDQGNVIIPDIQSDTGQRSIFPISILTTMPDRDILEITEVHQPDNMIVNEPPTNKDEIGILKEKDATNPKPYVCPDCQKPFAKKRYLRSHLRVHRHRGSFPCSICGTLFTYRCNLYRHTKKTHYAEKKISCEYCDEKFVNKRSLILHGKIHRGIKRKVKKASQPLHNFECNDCGRVFHRHFDIILHVRTHTGEKPFTCTICGRQFSHKGNMTRHAKTHERVDGVYMCKVCGKTLTSQKNYENHMEVHFGKKEYLCHVCGRRFNRPAGLAIHGKVHKREAALKDDERENEGDDENLNDVVLDITWSKSLDDVNVESTRQETGMAGAPAKNKIVAEILHLEDVH